MKAYILRINLKIAQFILNSPRKSSIFHAMSTKHKLICPLPTQESCESVNCDNILWDLGKATKRGTKKCPDCGYINGIRCYACKNPLCNRVLKIADKHKPGVHIDAIKLVSGATRQIYSVRVREKGGPINGLYPDHPDQRGFVQLPCAIYESDKLSEVALCFVDNCERSYSILKCHENDEDDEDTNTNKTNKTLNVLNFCAHIESAVKSLSVAHAFDFKHDLINNLKVCDDMKKKLCSLAKSTEGPLVQRIARNVLAIKCFVNSGNPLGYLHFMLEFKKSVSNASEEELERFHCECSAQGKCLHYYACVCAFASDVKLLHKYSQFIQREFDSCIAYDITTLLEEGKDATYPLENIRIEILRPDLLGLPLKRAKINKTKKKVKQIKVISDNIIKTSENNDKSTIKTNERLEYEEWLCYVIERINASKNLQATETYFNENILDELIVDVQEIKLEFHIHEKFFHNLQHHLRDYFQPNEFCVNTSTLHYTISTIAQLEQLFPVMELKINSYQLIINEQYPFRISWSSLYETSKFGELVFTFIKRN